MVRSRPQPNIGKWKTWHIQLPGSPVQSTKPSTSFTNLKNFYKSFTKSYRSSTGLYSNTWIWYIGVQIPAAVFFNKEVQLTAQFSYNFSIKRIQMSTVFFFSKICASFKKVMKSTWWIDGGSHFTKKNKKKIQNSILILTC